MYHKLKATNYSFQWRDARIWKHCICLWSNWNRCVGSFTNYDTFSSAESSEWIISIMSVQNKIHTGKTYTMEGDLSSSEQHGIIPRAAQAIFESLKKPDFTSYSISCSYLEIYNEDLGDLLADDLQTSSAGKGLKLEIMDSKEGTFCR